MVELFPESLLTRTDEALPAFEAAVAALDDPSDEQVLTSVRNVVLALNEVNREHGRAGYETGEREQLCDYIDMTLTEAGIDVPALARRNGVGRYAITDGWRPAPPAPLRPLPDNVIDLEILRVRRHDRAGGILHECRQVAYVEIAPLRTGHRQWTSLRLPPLPSATDELACET